MIQAGVAASSRLLVSQFVRLDRGLVNFLSTMSEAWKCSLTSNTFLHRPLVSSHIYIPVEPLCCFGGLLLIGSLHNLILPFSWLFSKLTYQSHQPGGDTYISHRHRPTSPPPSSSSPSPSRNNSGVIGLRFTTNFFWSTNKHSYQTPTTTACYKSLSQGEHPASTLSLIHI